MKCFATVSIKISPALDTPPPITNTCGLTTQAILDNAIPSVSPKISTASVPVCRGKAIAGLTGIVSRTVDIAEADGAYDFVRIFPAEYIEANEAVL